MLYQMGMTGGVFWICVGISSDFLRYFTNRRYIKGICGGGSDGA